MKENRITHSKCPYCSKHGIPAYFKWGKHLPKEVKCIYCEKTFKVPVWGCILRIVLPIFVGCLSGWIFEYYGMNHDHSLYCGIIMAIITMFVYAYFAPLKKLDN